MSFRNPFVTDYIYQAREELKEGNTKVKEVFEKYGHLVSSVDERGYGYYSGILKSLDGSIDDTGVWQLARELEKNTAIPFRLTILLESGPVITFDIKPNI